jgi:CheY-like chemotaxis protein
MRHSECKVLVVDDDVDTREALATALSDAGFQVEQAENGKQALERIDASDCEPDVILCDLHMPGMDGAEFLGHLRATGSRVIILTGDSSVRLTRFAREARLLQKPIDLDQLESAVKEACAA